MKNISIKIIIALSILSFLGINTIGSTYAEETGGITVIVTEKIPGANCISLSDTGLTQTGDVGKYECRVAKGFKSVIIMMGKIIKYFTYIAALGGTLFIVINGVLYSMGGAEPSMKDDAKKRIIGTLTGLVLLFLSGVILNLIAPWIYK